MAGEIEEAYVLITPRIDPAFGAKVSSAVDRAMVKVQRSADKAFSSVEKASERAAAVVDASMDEISADVGRKLKATIDVAIDSVSVEREIAQIEATLGEVSFDIDIGPALAEVEAFKAAVDDVTVKVDVDTDPAKSALDELLVLLPRNAKGAVDRTSIQFDRLGPALQSAVRDAEKAASFDLLPDNVKASFLAAERAAGDSLEQIGIKADDTSKRVSRVGSGGGGDKGAISTFGQLSFSLSKVALAAGGALSAIVPIGPSLVGVAAAATAVVGAAGLAAGSLISVGAAAASLGLAFAAVKIGSLGVSDAIKAQSKAQEELAKTGKVSEATQAELKFQMDKLAPSAQKLAATIAGLGKDYSELRKDTQQVLFAGTAPVLQNLSDKLLPAIRGALVGVAGDLNGFVKGFADSVTSARGLEIVNQILTGMRTSLQSIVPAIGNIVGGLAALFGASQGPANSLSETFLALSERFAAFSERVSANGSFEKFLTRAGDAAGKLVRVVTGLGTVLGGVFGAGAGAGVQILGALGDRLAALGDTIASVEGQSALAGFFANINVAGQAFADVLGAIRPVLAGIGDVLGQLAGPLDSLRASLLPVAVILGEQVGASLSALAPVIGTVAGAIATLVDVLSPLAPIILPIAAAFYATRAAMVAYRVIATATTAASYGLAGATYATGAASKLFTVLTLRARAALVLERISLVASAVAEKAKAAAGAASAAITRVVTAVTNSSLLATLRSTAATIAGTVAVVAQRVALVAISAATKAYVIVQAALNAVMAANPFVLAAIAIAALVAGIVYAYKNSEKFRAIVQKVGDVLKGAFQSSVKAVGKALEVMGKVFQKIRPYLLLLLGPIGAIILAFKNWDKIKAILDKVGSVIADFIGKAVAFFVSLPGKLLSALASLGSKLLTLFTTALNKVKTAIVAALTAYVSFYASLPGRILSALGSLISLLSGFFSRVFSAVSSIISTGISRNVAFFAALPGRIVSALGNLGSTIGGIFSRAFSSARSVVSNAITGIVTLVKSLPGKVLGVGQSLFNAGKSLIGRFVDGLKAVGGFAGELATNVGKSLVGLINKAIDKLNGAIPNKLGPINLPNSPIPHISLAKGGVFDRSTFAEIGEAGKEAVVPATRRMQRYAAMRIDQAGLLNLPAVQDLIAKRLAVPLASTTGRSAGPLTRPATRTGVMSRPIASGAPMVHVSVPAAPAPVIVKERSVTNNNTFALAPVGDVNTHAAQLASRLAAWSER